MVLRGPVGSAVSAVERQAEAPRAPEQGAGWKQRQSEHRRYVNEQETVERRSMLRGLMLLAVVALLVAFWRAGLGRVLVAGW